MLKTFLNNMTLMISFVYIIIKIKQKFEKEEVFIRMIFPLAAGVLSAITMMYPFNYKGSIFDLRQVPVFLAGYVLGPLGALIAALIPAAYRLSIGGPTAIQGVLLEVVLPAVVSSLFFYREKSGLAIMKLNMKRILKVYLVFSIVHISAGYVLFKIHGVISSSNYFKIMILTEVFAAATMALVAVMLNDEAQRMKHLIQLEHRSNHDALTGIYNRGYFYRKLNSAVLVRCKGGNCALDPEEELSLIMFDIDHFKRINDTFGHDVGDIVLKDLTNTVSKNIRKSDMFARIGGEEFAVVLWGSDIDHAAMVAEKIRRAVENHEFTTAGRVTISLGISRLRNGEDIDSLYKRADSALYRAKRGGRNRVELETEEDSEDNPQKSEEKENLQWDQSFGQ